MPLPKIDANSAHLIWIDPGSTSGICVVSIDPAWIAGELPGKWEDMGNAIRYKWHSQIGTVPRSWSPNKTKALDGVSVADRNGNFALGHAARRPAKNDPFSDVERAQGAGSFEEILTGEGGFGGGGPLRPEYLDEFRQLKNMQNLLNNWPDAAWGYEDFIPRQLNRSREFLSPVRLFTALTYSEIAHGVRGRLPFVQMPTLAKTTATDERLVKAKLYRPGMPHATDAARHVATFFRRARQHEDIRVAAWPHLFGTPGVEEYTLTDEGDMKRVK